MKVTPRVVRDYMSYKNLIFLDTETTGNEPGKDRLCQVCYKHRDDVFNEYFRPPVPISVKAMSVTHITNKMVADKEPFQNSRMFQELSNLLQDKILVAHNAGFDVAMLKSEGLDALNFICTLKLARYLDKQDEIPEYNLQFLRYYHDLEIDGNAHSADGDVKVLEAIFNLLRQKMEQHLGTQDESKVVEEMIKISSQPSLIKKVSFGKHIGKTMEEIAKTDPSYLRWLLTQKEQNPAGEEDWIYSIKYWLNKNLVNK